MERTIQTLRVLFLLLLVTAGIQAQEVNRLFVPDMTGVENSTITLPINLSNTNADIVAMQFELSVPHNAMVLNTSKVVLTDRKNDHTLALSSLGLGRYRFMVYSPSNKPFKANSGEVIEISATIADAVDHDKVFPIELSNVVLSNSKGDNVATTPQNGTFCVKAGVDFTVSGISVSPASVMPGDSIAVSWAVKNAGDIASTGGWSERIYLVSRDGTEKSLGTFNGGMQSLGAGSIVSRNTTIAVPELPGIDDEVKVKVTIVPNSGSGEGVAYQKNNTAETSRYSLNVGKRLTLELPASAIEEGVKPSVRCCLSRSGNWKDTQTFTLTKTSGDSRLSLPDSVTIRKGQSSAYFYITVSDNDVLDDESVFNIQASGNGYDPVSSTLTIEDDEHPQLTLETSKTDIAEGETFQLTVTTGRVSDEPIVVRLVSEKPKRFSHPPTITIPAGKTSATVDVTAVDNEEVELLTSITFKVSAEKYQSGECIIVLEDNDLPAIDLTLSPMAVSESAGPTAIVAKLRRMTNTDKKITIHLSDDSNGDVYYSSKSIVLDKGTEEAQFSLGIIDNAIVDGDRQVNITAAVYVSSCSCSGSGTSVGAVTKTIEIIDNDGPSLNVSSSKSTLLEGSEEGIMLTITRNTSTESPLSVSISCDNDNGLSYEHNVTIPAGAKSTDVKVKAQANSSPGDDRTLVFTVETADFSKATCWVMLTDQTLPDGQIADISVSKNEVEVGNSIDVSITICNMGAAELPEVTKTGLYINNSSVPVATLYTQQPLAPGEHVTLSKTITLPASVGKYEIYAVVNDGQSVKELLYVNNTSKRITVKTTSPFSATVSTDKAVYQQGEAIQVSGRVSGNATADTEVEVYVINEGLRQTIKTATDESGKFMATFQPYSAQMGHFIVGACYPGEGLKEEMASFDIYGLRRSSNTAITCDILIGEPFQGKFSLSNPGVLPLSGVKTTVISKPDNCDVDITVPGSVSGGGNIDVAYSLKGTAMSSGNSWEEIKVLIETAEGPSVNTTLYYYCRTPKGQLQANIPEIKTTMVKDASRDYPFTITNIGKGETGKITLSLPEWMSTATPREMASLAQEESATVILRLTPTENMQLNVPATGTIGINCENGNGIPLRYSIEPVSESTGTLTIDVCDEYTYYTEEEPHVAGAQVLVKHPTTGAIISKGLTDKNGLYSISLPEGYYTINVTADKHDSYTNNILIDPETETREVVNLSKSFVGITFTVEETEMEDLYTVVTNYVYETNVPAPVVVVSQSAEVDGDNMVDGESKLVNLTFTNNGLISAEKFTLRKPSSITGWNLEYLIDTDSIDIAPQQSFIVPVKITKLLEETPKSSKGISKVSAQASSNTSPMSACMAGYEYWYAHRCGKALKSEKHAYKMALKTCANSAILNALMQAVSEGTGGGAGNGGSGTPSPIRTDNSPKYKERDNTETIDREPLICDPDAVKCADEIINKLAKNYPGVGPYIEIFNDAADKCAEKAANGEKPDAGDVKDLADDLKEKYDDMVESIIEGEEASSKLEGLAEDAKDIIESCLDYFMKHSNKKAKALNDIPDYSVESTVEAYGNQLQTLDALLLEYYGDYVWYNEQDASINLFFNHIKSLNDVTYLNADNLMDYKPKSVSTTQFLRFIERMNGTNPDNSIDWNKQQERCAYIQQLENDAIGLGYNSMNDMYRKKIHEVYDDFSNPSSSVCSKVKLQLSQTVTMTRQAFRGTLTVSNGSVENAIKNIRLVLNIRNEEGAIATSHEFQVNLEKMTGFEGEMDMASGWSLTPKETGVASIMFIPTKYAAEKVSQDYSFGGTLSYIDPYTGLEVSRELSATTLTVNPSPNLDMTYFMQRDICGDDPLTEDIVEPSKPAEFALIINNKGNGDATNVRMVTNQPEIVENEKGLHIDFEMTSSQLNGKDNTLALGGSAATDFGTIPAHSTAYAQWWLQSSLLGHFTDYDVKATHVTSYGNEDLSMLDSVTIHELIHGFTVDDKADSKVRGFLVNDIVDAEDMPDMVYFTNGKQEENVAMASVSMTRNSGMKYSVTIFPSENGWNYGSVPDLTAGRQKLVSVVRQSDGKELPADNFWQTDRTLHDGKDPLYEYRLHAIVELEGEETFILTFEPKPETELKVERFTGIPEEGVVLTTPLTSLGVAFNKEIEEKTFTADDITLNYQGAKVDLTQATITKVGDREFSIGLDGATLKSGYYVLTVQTAGITDAEGFAGATGKSVSWLQDMDETGISDNLSNSHDFSIHPLPLHDVMYIDGDFSVIEKLVVSDVSGSMRIKEKKVLRGSAIDVASLPTGIYIVSVLTDNGKFIRKVLKK